MPSKIMRNLSFNDDLRRNLLLTNCLTLEKQGMMWSDFHDHDQIDYDKVCPVYLYSSDKMKLNRIIDDRVEDMVLNPQFLPEIVEFAKTLKSDEQTPFLVSIGFLDTVRYLKHVLSLMQLFGVDGVQKSAIQSRHLNLEP